MKMIFDKDLAAAEQSDNSQEIAEAEHAGRLVLLVEDNETNRFVMSMQISTLGYTAVIASNGQDALKLCRHHSFALILTDCSMPEMDGYELAKLIRKAESRTGKYTPIVAVTANADDRVVTRCLECGMDECIFKPVDMDELRTVIERWRFQPGSMEGCKSSGDELVVANLSGNEKSYSPVDPAVLHRLVGDDTEMHHRMLLKYLDTSPPILNSMIQAVDEKDLTSVVTIAHKFKSSTRTIGAEELADLIQSVEDAAKTNDDEDVVRLASLIKREFEKVVQYINGCGSDGSCLAEL